MSAKWTDKERLDQAKDDLVRSLARLQDAVTNAMYGTREDNLIMSDINSLAENARGCVYLFGRLMEAKDRVE